MTVASRYLSHGGREFDLECPPPWVPRAVAAALLDMHPKTFDRYWPRHADLSAATALKRAGGSGRGVRSWRSSALIAHMEGLTT